MHRWLINWEFLGGKIFLYCLWILFTPSQFCLLAWISKTWHMWGRKSDMVVIKKRQWKTFFGLALLLSHLFTLKFKMYNARLKGTKPFYGHRIMKIALKMYCCLSVICISKWFPLIRKGAGGLFCFVCLFALPLKQNLFLVRLYANVSGWPPKNNKGFITENKKDS